MRRLIQYRGGGQYLGDPMSEIGYWIGRAVRQLRERHGLTTRDLGARAGVSYRTIERMERGKTYSQVSADRVVCALDAHEADVLRIAAQLAQEDRT